jgi:DNA primase catalytic core
MVTTPNSPADAAVGGLVDQGWLEPDLAVAALVRNVAGPPEQTDADVDRMSTQAMAWQECAVSRDRMIEINQLALAYFRGQFPASWGQAYLAERFGQDLIDDPHFQPGQAPVGWTGLVDHLRKRGVTGEEMIVAGVATLASTGRLIDRFRDRVIFPIIHNAGCSHGCGRGAAAEILGFVGRRHPDRSDADRGRPKYLNTPETALFHKGAQLFGAVEEHLAASGVPVIVEGPMDAIAVTLASSGRYIGVAPLGTSLTDEQASQLAEIGRNPIVATDANLAGRVAAERDFWILTPHRLDPLYAQLPEGSDPADHWPGAVQQRSPPPWTGRGCSATSSPTNGSPTCYKIKHSTRRRESSPPGLAGAGMRAAAPSAPASTSPCLRCGRRCWPM